MAESKSSDAAAAVICVLGPPGSGKTETSAALGQTLRANVVHGGRMLRALADGVGELAAAVDEIVSSARPVPVELYCRLVRESISSDGGWLVLDGYPRNLDQYHSLWEVCRAARIARPVTIGVFLEVDVREVRRRVESRRIATHRGDDADPELVTKRMALYSVNESILRRCFWVEFHAFSVQSAGSPEAVAETIASRVATLMSRVTGVHSLPE